jgi:para-nitrobenzyl esterase
VSADGRGADPNPHGDAAELGARVLVDTTSGPVRGFQEDGVRYWRGIPYACPPVGALRWRAPQRPTASVSVIDARDFGAVCPQPPNPMIALAPGTRQDEDCLTLNIAAPPGCDPGDPCPVMVWVHGGAYLFGASSQPLFDPKVLVCAAPVVVVSVNYRLGALGFLDLSRFSTAEDRFDSNLAVRDVLCALEWVRDNIAAFGGDPDAVTLAGESAGGGLVATLLTVPAAEGLFSRAIVESAPATSVYDQERGARVAGLFLEELGLGADEPGRLRELPAEQLVSAGFRVYSRVPQEFPGTLAYAPIVDGDLVPDYPLNRFRAGLAHPVPLLIGTNKDEAAMFKLMKSPLMPITSEAIMQMFADMAADHPGLSMPSEAQVGSAYTGISLKAKGLGVARDLGFRMPTVWLAEGHSTVADVYLYRFDWATPMLHLLGIGATHATELPYVWGNLVSGPKDITFRLGGLNKGRRLSRRLRSRWLAFVAGGTPRAEDAVDWPAYRADAADDPGHPAARATLVIDAIDRLAPDLDRELRLAWGDDVLSFL